MSGSKNYNILIIDNHNSNENDFASMFKNTSLNVYVTDGIKNGVEIAARYVPDIIICSVTSFDIGKKLIEDINLQVTLRFIPIMYISSLEEPDKEFREVMNMGIADYFCKNFNKQDLISSIEVRVGQVTEFKNYLFEKYHSAFEAEKLETKDHILISVGKRLQLIKFERIICITAEKEYSKIKILNGRSIIVRKSLKNWLNVLPEKNFVRIHRQSIINIDAIEKIEKLKSRTYVVYLKSISKPLELSRRYFGIMRKTFL